MNLKTQILRIYLRTDMRLIVTLIFSVCVVTAVPNRESRGSCLSLCGQYGVDCPAGYECRSNGCGHECYRPLNYVVPEGCTTLHCPYHCPLGYQVDESGCDVCACDYSRFSRPDITV
ncbi:cysteine-rich motor neuron 1 protein-like isoform X2 [Ostrea edulis]|uniref:cysteine-rich motor neuron 1 protein-like isoform X2 n=1 Tax=Ostrea edulis TaxID=37623 RepID=UPI002095587D|nr:cysteine-rich motor neuron 1 protein-like isoform X2 [Ostrea edulis]